MKTIIGGLDLGQSADPSAFVLAEVESIVDPDQTGIVRGQPARLVNRYDVRHIWRWPLGTKYPVIVAHLREWYCLTNLLLGSTLVVDGTGVGRAVVDMIEEAALPCDVQPFSITAGKQPKDKKDCKPGEMPTVPKKDLVGVMMVLLENRRLRWASGLELRNTLEKELACFQETIDEKTRNETYAAGRVGVNDDIVLACSLLCWYGEKHGSGDRSPVLAKPGRDKPLIDPNRIERSPFKGRY